MYPGDVQHSYSDEEKIAFVDWINEVILFSLLTYYYSVANVYFFFLLYIIIIMLVFGGGH